MDPSPGAKLNKGLTSDYKSCGNSSELANGSSSNDLMKHEPVQLKDMSSGSSNKFDQGLSEFKEGKEDSCSHDVPKQLYAAPVIFAIGVTFAFVLTIYLDARLVLKEGVLSDHELCTALGERVLLDGGSSVDAAIAGALCLGVVHPHVSGVGGGGVMLIHDMQKNETMVINFQGSAPKAVKEEMLQNASEIKAGLLVGVPGMLMGLHNAHSLYGSLSWVDVVSRAADVAREGFNVSHSLADAISEIQGEQLLERFRDLFIPDGRALRPGSHIRMPGLAEALEAGLLNFYRGTLSEEMASEVQANGGVLSREDISNYSVEVQQPLEGRYRDFIIQVPPPPSAGAALITALNLLEGFNFSQRTATENQTNYWISEALTEALGMARGLGDPKYNSSKSDLLSVMLSKNHTELLHERINRTQIPPPESTSTAHPLRPELMAGQVVVMGPDNLMVSVASSLSRPFGSRIITKSGIILNSIVLDFIQPNKNREKPQTDQANVVEPGKRPLTFLMPAVMIPVWQKCGTYMALSSSGGQNRLRAVTQMLVRVLFHTKDKNDSLPLPPQIETSGLLDDTKLANRSVVLAAKKKRP